MATGWFRTLSMTAVSTLVLAVSLLPQSTWAFVTPLERMSVHNRMDKFQKESSTVRLGMSSKRTKTLIPVDEESLDNDTDVNRQLVTPDEKNPMAVTVAATSSTILGLATLSEIANAISVPAITMPKELTANFDPNSFVPVCAASNRHKKQAGYKTDYDAHASDNQIAADSAVQ